jgi:hypothetical protein
MSDFFIERISFVVPLMAEQIGLTATPASR